MLPISIENFLAFNKKMFPKRRNINQATLIDWRIVDNPFYTDFKEGLIASNSDKNLGQIIPIYSRFISDEHDYNCVWGSDYIVLEEKRGTNAGVKVLQCMIKNYLHFGVGMSSVSLQLHKILREKEIGKRYDSLFFSFKKSVTNYNIIDFDTFLNSFPSIKKKCFKVEGINYFERDIPFYKWVFNKANKNKIKIVCNNNSSEFVIFYHSKKFGIPIIKVVDFSPGLNSTSKKLVDFIRFYSRKSLIKLFFFSGSMDIVQHFTSIRHKEFPVCSNIGSKNLKYNSNNRLHVTGLDSDRFISEFL